MEAYLQNRDIPMEKAAAVTQLLKLKYLLCYQKMMKKTTLLQSSFYQLLSTCRKMSVILRFLQYPEQRYNSLLHHKRVVLSVKLVYDIASIHIGEKKMVKT